MAHQIMPLPLQCAGQHLPVEEQCAIASRMAQEALTERDIITSIETANLDECEKRVYLKAARLRDAAIRRLNTRGRVRRGAQVN